MRIIQQLISLWIVVGCAATTSHSGPPLPSSDERVWPGGPPPGAPPRERVPSKLAAVWATEGGDKVAQEELRVSRDKLDVKSEVWDGQGVRVMSARNEVVGFVLVLEAGSKAVEKVSVELNELKGPGGASLASAPPDPERIFDWTQRQIELFYVRYLPLKGLSLLPWEHYDERHVPVKLRRKFEKTRGKGIGTWRDRPWAGKSVPDIAVPMEVVGAFDIASERSQCVWVDIFVPKTARPGTYMGTVTIRVAGKATRQVPVSLQVWKFELPDVPRLGTMVQLGYADVNQRYLGQKYPTPGVFAKAARRIRDRHFLVAHRHKLQLIDANEGPEPWTKDAPRDDWRPRLDGSLFTPAYGYDGPGIGRGNGVFSVGTYGSWSWKNEGKTGMWAHTDAWARWFETYAPETEAFLYLIDESSEFEKIEKWAQWMAQNPGPGKRLLSMATIGLPDAVKRTPSLQAPTASLKVGKTGSWERAARKLAADPSKRLWLYNGGRPACGTLALEDDGVALRQIGWTAFKKNVSRWFFWESTYYNNFQGGMGQTNVFRQAHTFGTRSSVDPSLGETGWNYMNGDGVLFYPGTDALFPADSYGVMGPFASLRLKYLRRGVQDADYLALAHAIAPKRTAAIVERMIPKVLWDYGVDSQTDPTYKHTDISWSADAQVWESARRELGRMIDAAAR